MTVGVVKVRNEPRLDLFTHRYIQTVIVRDGATLYLIDGAISCVGSSCGDQRRCENPELVKGVHPRVSVRQTLDAVANIVDLERGLLSNLLLNLEIPFHRSRRMNCADDGIERRRCKGYACRHRRLDLIKALGDVKCICRRLPGGRSTGWVERQHASFRAHAESHGHWRVR